METLSTNEWFPGGPVNRRRKRERRLFHFVTNVSSRGALVPNSLGPVRLVIGRSFPFFFKFSSHVNGVEALLVSGNVRKGPFTKVSRFERCFPCCAGCVQFVNTNSLSYRGSDSLHNGRFTNRLNIFVVFRARVWGHVYSLITRFIQISFYRYFHYVGFSRAGFLSFVRGTKCLPFCKGVSYLISLLFYFRFLCCRRRSGEGAPRVG